MDEFEMDRLFETLDVPVDPAVERRVWLASSRALSRGRRFRKVIWRAGSAAAAAVLCAGAFLAGQRSVGGAGEGISTQADAGNAHMVTITVDREFLEWIDAGRFFAQLEMKEKSAEAFERAIEMIPEETVRQFEREAAGDRVAGVGSAAQFNFHNTEL